MSSNIELKTVIPGLGDSFPLKLDYLVGKLQKAFVVKIFPNKISGRRLDEGIGYMSLIAYVNLEWSDTDEGKPLPKNVVVKIPTSEKLVCGLDITEGNSETEFAKLMYDFVEQAHNNEVLMYNIIREITGPWPSYLRAPEMYLGEPLSTKMPGLVIMEDFSDIVTLIDSEIGLNFDQTCEILDQIAILQAFGIANEAKWKGRVGTFGSVEMNQDIPVFIAAADKCLREKFGHLQMVDITAVRDFVTPKEYYELQNPTPDQTVHQVLVHGDVWTNNCLFLAKNIDGKKTPTNTLGAIIDWQHAHPGSPAADIAQLLASSVSPQLRRAKTGEFLDRFYSKIRETLRNKWTYRRQSMITDSEMPFTRKQLGEEYEKMWRFATAFVLMQFGLRVGTSLEPAEKHIQLALRTVAAVEDALCRPLSDI